MAAPLRVLRRARADMQCNLQAAMKLKRQVITKRHKDLLTAIYK